MTYHLDALIESYLACMQRFSPWDEPYLRMDDEVERLLELQRTEGIVPYTERRR